MLVLTRRKNESIMIGDDIEIKITRVCGNNVRVGIIAPREVRVYRKELPLLSMTAPGAGGVKNEWLHSFLP